MEEKLIPWIYDITGLCFVINGSIYAFYGVDPLDDGMFILKLLALLVYFLSLVAIHISREKEDLFKFYVWFFSFVINIFFIGYLISEFSREYALVTVLPIIIFILVAISFFGIVRRVIFRSNGASDIL